MTKTSWDTSIIAEGWNVKERAARLISRKDEGFYVISATEEVSFADLFDEEKYQTLRKLLMMVDDYTGTDLDIKQELERLDLGICYRDYIVLNIRRISGILEEMILRVELCRR